MGKTAIARMVSLVALTDGWEAHECIRPEQLWASFRRDQAQVFVADDAFGSTEYSPEAAERWALELDRVLRAMDERHWLIWTSRPAPLKAGLRRIHREHGIERWPQPAEVQINASALGVEEKALILFRHTRAAAPGWRAVELVQEHGWGICANAHFTPERIRRFVWDRLPHLAAARAHATAGQLAEAIRDEIREPTVAMATSLHALGPEQLALLVALLDCPPGPAPERDVATALRRLSDGGLEQAPGELVDRLTDHFVRVVPPASLTWVHPSWRDLVIEDLRASSERRRAFLARCSLDGTLLALSVAGGAGGERSLPLLVEDADWDTITDRLFALVPELDTRAHGRLLIALAAATDAQADERAASELHALSTRALDLTARRWDAGGTPLPITLFDAWLGLARRTPDRPAPPDAGPTWIELAPTGRIDTSATSELVAFDDWVSLAAVLAEHEPDALQLFGFPSRQNEPIELLIYEVGRRAAARGYFAERATILESSLRRLAPLVPNHEWELIALADLLRRPEVISAWPERERPQRRTPENQEARALVASILRDLTPGAPRRRSR
jgi:hypothetical protein